MRRPISNRRTDRHRRETTGARMMTDEPLTFDRRHLRDRVTPCGKASACAATCAAGHELCRRSRGTCDATLGRATESFPLYGHRVRLSGVRGVARQNE